MSEKTYRLGLLTLDGCMLSSLSGPADALHIAQILSDIRTPHGGPRFESVLQFRNELRNLWEGAHTSNERLLADFREWCVRAEQSGIGEPGLAGRGSRPERCGKEDEADRTGGEAFACALRDAGGSERKNHARDP